MITLESDKHKAKTQPSAELPSRAPNQAISFVVTYDKVAHMVEASRPLPRPNRTRPIHDPGATATDVAESLAIAIGTPSVAELKQLAADNPPPREFFDGDMDRPW